MPPQNKRTPAHALSTRSYRKHRSKRPDFRQKGKNFVHPFEKAVGCPFPANDSESNLHPTYRKTQMNTTLQPPNITLPEEALQKLYAKALHNGMSLKAYIEGLLIEDANAPSFAERVSPSADAWFDHPQNVAAVRRGLQQQAAGLAQSFSIEEIKRLADL